MLSSTCLLGAVVCDFKPPELSFLWNRLENKSRHPSLFLEWLHWYGYILLGGGTAAMIAGPVVMFGNICYNTMPQEEAAHVHADEERARKDTDIGDGHTYRHRQRTVSAFWPVKYSNRYVSDHHLYETVVQKNTVVDGAATLEDETTLQQFISGEWVVDVDVRPTYDQLLGRQPMAWTSIFPKWITNNISPAPAPVNTDSVDDSVDDSVEQGGVTTAVLIRPRSAGSRELDMRYTDGRAFRLLPIANSVGKYKVLPLLPTPDEQVEFYTRLPALLFNWIAADQFRLDPNEVWLIDVGSEGNDAYVVLSDGDMRSRYQALRRPGNREGGLHPQVRARICNEGQNQGFAE